MSHGNESSAHSRRQFLALSAAAGVTSVIPMGGALAASRARGIGGVAVGAISYSFRDLPGDAAKVLEYLLACGIDTVELMGDAAEDYAGAPPTEQGRKLWRKSVPMARYQKLRKLYDDAGVKIDILKLGEASWADADIDYAYEVAGVLGARGISFEAEDQAAKRMAAFADKHQLLNGMHNHMQYGEAAFDVDRLLAYSPRNMLNLDVGHYVASTGQSPLPFLRKYHARITHLHLKDRKSLAHGGDNMPWGQGDTPLREVLQLLQKERYPISAMIELEYPVPQDSDVLAETRKCVAYCRAALV
jgi:sugar phosphate isomerase/epimerase